MSHLDSAIEKWRDLLSGKNQARYRLTDILVEEVSLVDRAANKRKFLVVKKAPQGEGTEMNIKTKAVVAAKTATTIEQLVATAAKIQELASDDAPVADELVAELLSAAAPLAELVKVDAEPVVLDPAPSFDAEKLQAEIVAAVKASVTDVANAVTLSSEALTKAVSDLRDLVVAKAEPAPEPAPEPEPAVSAEVADLTKALEQAKAQTAELQAQVQKLTEDPPTRASEGAPKTEETVAKSAAVFPMYYNDPTYDPAPRA